LRVEAFKRILAQPRSWFEIEENSAARLSECLDRNAEEMRNLVGRFAGPIFTTIWMLGISIIWAFLISGKLSLVAMGCVPVVWATTSLFSHISSKWEERCNVLAAQTGDVFTETFSNIRVLRAFTLESYFKRKHMASTTRTYKTGLSRALYSGVAFGLGDAISFFITATIFYYGTVITTRGALPVSAVLKVVNLLLFGLANSMSILSLIPQLSSSRATATHMLYLANLPLHSHESLGTHRLATPFPIHFNNLSFTYPSRPRQRTLSSITLTLTLGSRTALVGPSGSGKSTLASLILALYPPDPVAPHHPAPLTFAGIPVTSWNISSLRSHIAIVPQSPTLFPATILENIIYGLPEGSPLANLNAATLAARDAGIDEFVSSLPNGYQTLVGDGGQGLSGGQTQRIAIARALVRRPKVLILDEATSALDAISAGMVRETISKLVERGQESGEGGMAVLVIAHGVEMMRICERIVVLEGGQISEVGSFDELRWRGGAFARLIGGSGLVGE
jgi:ATP-binding cassette, subfamily B (MDR/TAP), member 1